MTCVETRERFLDLDDDSLDAAARAAVDEHLARCEACRRELDRYRTTVALLGAVERPRAPVGFVNRVMDRLRPRPWYRRLGTRLLFPLPIKLPLEAAAIALLAIGVVHVFQRTPELQQTARMEDLTRDREAPRAVTPPASSSGAVSRSNAGTAGSASAKATGAQTDRLSTSEAKSQQGDATRTREPVRGVEAGSEGRRVVPEQPAEANAEQETRAAQGERVAAPSASVQRAAPPTRIESAPSVAAAPPSRFAAKADVASVTGRLAVTDHAEGARAVEALARRYGATVVSRHETPDGVALELRLARGVYRGFMGELPGLGQWTVDRELASLPDEPVIRIRVERGPERRPRTSDAP